MRCRRAPETAEARQRRLAHRELEEGTAGLASEMQKIGKRVYRNPELGTEQGVLPCFPRQGRCASSNVGVPNREDELQSYRRKERLVFLMQKKPNT